MPKTGVNPGASDTVVASGSRTASGDSGVLTGWGIAEKLRAQLDVTAFTVAAGNTLDVVIEDTLDGTNWNVIGTFAQKAAAGREVINITNLFADRIRVRWTLAGAPAPTFAVDVYSE